jgi:tetratricopeptide (TPR) repeat protein
MRRLCLIAVTALFLWSAPIGAQPDLAAEAQRGKQALAEGRFADAAAIYAQLVRAIPADAGMRLNLGMALSMAGRLRDAIPHLERAVELRPALVPAWLFLGSNWLELGQPSKALPALRKVAAAEPGNTRARELLGEALLALERYERAATEFRASTGQQPSSARGWYGLGRSYEGLARATFAALETEHADSAYALALRGDVMVASRQTEAANELYRRAIELEPAIREAVEGTTPRDCGTGATAACEFVNGRYLLAVNIAKAARTPASQYWLIRSYNELAREAFGKLSALPASPEAHQFRAELLTNRGRHLEAAEELQKALTLVPDDPRLMKQLAVSLHRGKSYEEALTLLDRVVQRDRSADVLFLLGDTLVLVGRSAEGVKALEEALALEPKLAAAHASLGRAYLQTGDARAAVPHLEAAVATDEDGSLHYQLARAYEATGKPELVKKMLEKYAALEKSRRR